MGRQGGGGDKKAQLFGAILNQKLPTVRWGLANAGVAPATRDDDGKTTFMIACAAGRDKSLGEMIRWYERRLAQLRECLELTDDDTGETCFHMAAQAPNGQKCVSQLLDAWLSVDKQRKDAGIKKKDHRGRTVYDVATPKARAIIDDWLVEPETESEDEDELVDGLTKTQRSKLKKRELEAKERAGSVMPPPPPTVQEETEGVERGEFKEGRPDETWPEVGKWAQSVRDLKPICELTISRESDDDLPLLPCAGPDEPSSVIDPALYWCDTVNRLSLKLGPRLTYLSPTGLARMANLTHLIVPGHALTALPDTLGSLPLKSLDASRNQLTALPTMPTKIEAVDVSGNQLTSIQALEKCVDLVTLQFDANQVTSIELPFASFKRLVTLSCGSNLLTELPDAIGDAAKLEALTVNENKELTSLPATLAKCKKLKSIKCDGCPIKDNKVLGYISKGEYKQLGKYLEKTAKQGGRGGGKGKKKK